MPQISFQGQSLIVTKWSPDHPYKRTESYLADTKGKFYSSLYPASKNGFLFEKDGLYGLLDIAEGKAFELTKQVYWNKFKTARDQNKR